MSDELERAYRESLQNSKDDTTPAEGNNDSAEEHARNGYDDVYMDEPNLLGNPDSYAHAKDEADDCEDEMADCEDEEDFDDAEPCMDMPHSLEDFASRAMTYRLTANLAEKPTVFSPTCYVHKLEYVVASLTMAMQRLTGITNFTLIEPSLCKDSSWTLFEVLWHMYRNNRESGTYSGVYTPEHELVAVVDISVIPRAKDASAVSLSISGFKKEVVTGIFQDICYETYNHLYSLGYDTDRQMQVLHDLNQRLGRGIKTAPFVIKKCSFVGNKSFVHLQCHTKVEDYIGSLMNWFTPYISKFLSISYHRTKPYHDTRNITCAEDWNVVRTDSGELIVCGNGPLVHDDYVYMQVFFDTDEVIFTADTPAAIYHLICDMIVFGILYN